jgi:hypothetical protein
MKDFTPFSGVKPFAIMEIPRSSRGFMIMKVSAYPRE